MLLHYIIQKVTFIKEANFPKFHYDLPSHNPKWSGSSTSYVGAFALLLLTVYAYYRCTNLGKKNLADIVAIYGRGRELFRPPT